MAPPVEAFHASELRERVQTTAEGRQRKEPVDLEKCEILEMVQYSCYLMGGKNGQQPDIKCEPIIRAFRRYVDELRYGERKGLIRARCRDGCMVETTAWNSREY